MNFLSIFSTSNLDDFAHSLVQDIVRRYPPEVNRESDSKNISTDKITRILENGFKRAAIFTTENNLGYFKKARLGNKFKWSLKDAGYNDAFVEMATEGLIVYITKIVK